MYLGVHGLHEWGAATCADAHFQAAAPNGQTGNVGGREVGGELSQLHRRGGGVCVHDSVQTLEKDGCALALNRPNIKGYFMPLFR